MSPETLVANSATFPHETSPFALQNRRLSALPHQPPLPAGDGHRLIGEDIWLSVEAGRGAQLSAMPVDGGLRIALHEGQRARWASLFFGLPIEGLVRGRQVGLEIAARSQGFFSYRPCLRYLRADRSFTDTLAADYMISSGGQRRQFAHMPVDRALLAECQSAELHVFFQGGEFEVDIQLVEAFLII